MSWPQVCWWHGQKVPNQKVTTCARRLLSSSSPCVDRHEDDGGVRLDPHAEYSEGGSEGGGEEGVDFKLNNVCDSSTVERTAPTLSVSFSVVSRTYGTHIHVQIHRE